MLSFGYTLSSEEHSPVELVENARRAEEAGFDFLTISDHFHPWLRAQGHSPFVWSVLGAIAASTRSIRIGTGVTCPTTRIHPVIIAHAAATTSLLFEGRFFLGVGTGEALNEHVLGHRWPPPHVRRGMLDEAVDIIRMMWTGDTIDHHGDFYTVENARLFDAPTTPPPIIVSGFGEDSIATAARIGDGLWGHGADPGPAKTFEALGGHGPRFAQLKLCWAESEDAGRQVVHEMWANTGIPGQLSQDLPTWTHFEEAVQLVTEGIATESVPCGPALEPIVDSVQRLVDAGFDHLHLHQIGPDQLGFFEFWTETLQPALSSLSEPRRAQAQTSNERSSDAFQVSAREE